MRAKKLPLFQQPEAKQVLLAACRRRNTSPKLLEKLIDLQRQFIGSGRRDGINSDVDFILGDELDS
jgi:hypothetical protein